MSRPRDTQRAKLFQAQRALLAAHQPGSRQKVTGSPFTFPPLTINQTQSYAEQVVGSRWWAQNGPRLRIAVVDWNTRYCSVLRSGWKPGYDCMSLRERNALSILHALAHKLHDSDTAWHGPEFVRQYIRLVDRFEGQVAGKALRAELLKHRVKTKALSDESKLKRAVARTTKLMQDLQDNEPKSEDA